MNVVLKLCEQYAENEGEMVSEAPVIKYEFSNVNDSRMVADDSTIQH